MAANGITGELADKIFDKMLAFANFGFPESHSISFASLVYASAWFKLYHPAAFCAALLNAQPMGFYSPQSLVADARRHGVRVRGPDVNLGGAQADAAAATRAAPAGRRSGWGWPASAAIGEKLAEQIEAERARGGPYRDLADLARRVRLTVAPGRGAGHGRGVRLLRGGPAGGAVGGRGGRRRCGRSSCRAPPSASTRRRCRG